jgi:deoxyribonuclease V
MQVSNLHPWDLAPRAAIELQRRLVSRLELREPRHRRFELVAGADVAVSRRLNRLVAGVVLMRPATGEVVETAQLVVEPTFPYVPGLLSFREAPGLIGASVKLRRVPDAVICDGQGIAHPRGFGLASHLGLWLGVPTIGSAKSRLVGDFRTEPGRRRGSRVPLSFEGRAVGVVLRTRDGVKPLFVSPGHQIDIDTAAQVVLACCTRYRLPEPQRQADQLVGRVKRELEIAHGKS